MKTAKIFQQGQYQIVQLPQEFQFDGKKVFVKQWGNAVVLMPLKNSGDPLIKSLPLFSDDFMPTRNQPEL